MNNRLFGSALAAGFVLLGGIASATTVQTVEVANAFDDGSSQVYYADIEDWYAGFVGTVPPAVTGNTATVGAGVELPNFLLYDIDVTGNEIEFTLVDNTFNNVGVPSGEADVYYMEFDVELYDVSLLSADSNFNIELELIEAGESLTLPDAIGLNGGTDKTIFFENGGIAVRVSGGTLLDDDQLGNSFTVEIAPVPLPAGALLLISGLGGLVLARRRMRA